MVRNKSHGIGRHAGEGFRRGRSAMTLVELLIAMVSATMLLAMLASMTLLANRLLSQSTGDATDESIQVNLDRIDDDLRYATNVNLYGGYYQVLTRPDAVSGADVDVTYTYSYNPNQPGVTRKVGASAAQFIQTDGSIAIQSVDGYSGPTSIARPRRVRIKSVTQTSEENSDSLTISVPEVCDSNDWIVAVVGSRHAKDVELNDPQWTLLRESSKGSLDITCFLRSPTASQSDSVITFDKKSDAIAVVIVIDDEASPWPIRSIASASDKAESSDPTTWASPVSVTDLEAQDLNLQVFVCKGSQWDDDSVGIPGYVDLAIGEVATGNKSDGCGIGVVSRTGPPPILTAPIRVDHEDHDDWLAIGLAIGGETW